MENHQSSVSSLNKQSIEGAYFGDVFALGIGETGLGKT